MVCNQLLRINMEEEQIIFEEDEVVWAKIRGYPWWPAYINQLHPISDQEYQYTVVFFGDNTNARVDSLKLRKFIDSYIECYLKAKTNRKLMTSINMAEDKLRQNDQNVEIFQQLRSRIKEKKGKGRVREPNESHSHVMESGDVRHSRKASENQIFQQNQQSAVKEELSSVKPKQNRRNITKRGNGQTEDASGRKDTKQMELQQNIHENVQQSPKLACSKPKQTGKNQSSQSSTPLNLRKSSIPRQVDIVIDLKELHESEKPKQDQKMVEQSVSEDSEKIVVRKRRKRNQLKRSSAISEGVEDLNKNKNEKEHLKSMGKRGDGLELQRHKTDPKDKIIEEGKGKVITRKKMEIKEAHREQSEKDEEDEMSVQIAKTKQNVRSLSTGHPLSRGPRPIVPQARKRGRPKKVEVIREPSSQEDYQDTVKLQSQPKRKIIRKPIPLPPKQPEKSKGISIADQTVISGVQKLLHNRDGLIDFLSRSAITVGNVKEILDMDVSQILQEGTINQQVLNLLELLRAALVYKYFPDDLKHRKKYQKLMKRKNIGIQDEQQDKNISNQKLPKMANFEAEEDQDKEVLTKKIEIRKKTGLKVKKFLTGLAESEERIQKISHKIEDYIYKSDSDVGPRYCNIAFLVLSALKQKKETYQQIINKLESKLYD